MTTNASSSHCEAQLYIFEDNGAVIKMIIKGRSPMMRYESRTHRVALDWLFDRINLNTKIKIKYVDIKNQLADLLTKGSFTSDEWCNLLRLFNIMYFSTSLAAIVVQMKWQAPWRRKFSGRKTGEEPAVAKPRSTCLIARNVLNQKQPSSSGSDASNVPVNPQLDSEFCVRKLREIATRQKSKPSNVFSREE